VISLQLPAARTRLLIGSDNVDRWSEQRIWDAALKDVQIVVSTHAVLADALSHGFVNISQLALLIFDEGKPGRQNICALSRSCPLFT
jgi:ERCC4-related helicase